MSLEPSSVRCYPAAVKKAYEPMSDEEMGRVFNFPAPANPDGWWHLLANIQVNTYCNGLHGMPDFKNIAGPL